MTLNKITLDELYHVRNKLIEKIPFVFTEKQMEFMISFTNANPDWSISDLPDHVKYMPSIRWRLFNLEKLRINDPNSHKKLIYRTQIMFENFLNIQYNNNLAYINTMEDFNDKDNINEMADEKESCSTPSP